MARILIVDDEPDLVRLLEYNLKQAGFETETASTGELALATARARKPDAIILDLRMPAVDGIGFLRRLRAREDLRQVPVAVVTGDYFLDDQVSTELEQLGATLKFKPLWLEDLVGLARTLLR